MSTDSVPGMPRQPVTPPYVPLRTLREASELSLVEACHRLEIVAGIKITPAFLASVETGKRGPSQDVLDGLSRVYMVRLRMDREPKPANATRQERAS